MVYFWVGLKLSMYGRTHTFLCIWSSTETAYVLFDVHGRFPLIIFVFKSEGIIQQQFPKNKAEFTFFFRDI
jgi:hypothetical protein